MARYKLLIADDHLLFLDGLTSLLRKEKDLEIICTATDGQEVLNILNEQEIDLCLLDINMPGLDGIDTARQIRKDRPQMKIIILTTYNDKAIISAMAELGIPGYLLKNSTKKELMEAIRKVMDGGYYFSREIQSVIISNFSSQDEGKKDDKAKVVLTPREIEIIRLLAREYTNEKIATELNISYRTVETHRKNLMHKTKSQNLAGLLSFAFHKGLVS
jgi:two-component system nitrate/nitrite response regulator NarL